jgi:restriction system protein
MAIPSLEDLYNPILQAITQLGGSASTAELNQEVLKNLDLTEEELAETTNTGAPKVLNRIAWSRINLKGVGLLDKSDLGIWLLTPKGKAAGTVNPRQITREYNRLYAAQRKARTQQGAGNGGTGNPIDQAATTAT